MRGRDGRFARAGSGRAASHDMKLRYHRSHSASSNVGGSLSAPRGVNRGTSGQSARYRAIACWIALPPVSCVVGCRVNSLPLQPPPVSPASASASNAYVQLRPERVPKTGDANAGAFLASSGGGAAKSGAPLKRIRITPADVEDAVSAEPADYSLRMDAAGYYLRSGRNRQAIKHLKVAVFLRPRAVLSWVALGDAQALDNQGAAARQSYARAFAHSPKAPLAFRGLGQLLVRERKFQDARRILEEGLKMNPQSIELEAALANVYLVLQKNSLAKPLLQRVTLQSPTDADAHYLLALAYERDLQLNAALREARAAAYVEPGFAEAWGLAGLYLAKLTRFAEARAPLEQAIRLAPRESHFYWALGECYPVDPREPHNAEMAISLYRNALALDPRNSKALHSLATALMRRGEPADMESARPLLKRILQLDPRDSEALYRLAEVCRATGRVSEARDALARFQAIPTEHLRRQQ